MIRRFAFALTAFAGAVLSAQFPEFYQQYLQRLHGRLDILEQRAREIREDAALQGLDVGDYINLFTASAEHALEGQRMRASLIQEEEATAALSALEGASPIARLPAFLRHFDTAIAGDTAGIYRPALPFSFEGVLYAGLGGLTALVLAALVTLLAGKAWRRVIEMREMRAKERK